MSRMSLIKAGSQMTDAVNRVTKGGDRIVLERRGKGVAALVSMEDLAALEAMEDEQDVKDAKRAMKEKGFITLEEVKARLGMK